jgi:plastocyanin
MIRFAKISLAAAVLALGVAGGALAAPHKSASASASSAVQASGSEFRITLSRGQVKPSKLRLEFVNYGEDEHDLAVRRVGTSLVRNLGTTQPGDRAIKRFKVRAGTYLMWCTISDHRARGMKTSLKVRKNAD